jgi:hypothetical protein
VLSPDDRRLAMSFPADYLGNGQQPGLIRVLDLRTGAWRQVPGVTAPFFNLTWSPNGQWLAAGVSWPDHKRLIYWRLGAAQLQLQRHPLPGGWRQAPLVDPVAYPG